MCGSSKKLHQTVNCKRKNVERYSQRENGQYMKPQKILERYREINIPNETDPQNIFRYIFNITYFFI